MANSLMNASLFSCRQKVSFGGEMLGAGRPLAQQRGEGKTLAGGDFEGRFSAALGRVRTFAHDPALLDDVKVFNRAIGRLDDALAGRIKTQLTLLNQVTPGARVPFD